MDGGNATFLLERPIFRGYVSFRGVCFVYKDHSKDLWCYRSRERKVPAVSRTSLESWTDAGLAGCPRKHSVLLCLQQEPFATKNSCFCMRNRSFALNIYIIQLYYNNTVQTQASILRSFFLAFSSSSFVQWRFRIMCTKSTHKHYLCALSLLKVALF